MNVAFIPAKGESSRVPQKNTRPLGGIPLFEWTVRAALAARFDAVVVSTDTPRIENHALSLGATVIRRPVELARDPVQVHGVAVHALEVMESWGWSIDTIAMLLPTSPFRSARHIIEAMALHGPRASVVSGVRVREDKAFRVVDGRLEASRDAVTLNGAIWITTPNRLVIHAGFPVRGSVPYLMDADEGLDIDTLADLATAERMLHRFQPDGLAVLA